MSPNTMESSNVIKLPGQPQYLGGRVRGITSSDQPGLHSETLSQKTNQPINQQIKLPRHKTKEEISFCIILNAHT
jgi:hypothetical protein